MITPIPWLTIDQLMLFRFMGARDYWSACSSGCRRSFSTFQKGSYPEDLKALAAAIIELRKENQLLAYHDRSDGGLFACIAEMAFASHIGISMNVDMIAVDVGQEPDYGDAKNWSQQVSGLRHEQTMRALFTEELGIIQNNFLKSLVLIFSLESMV